MPPEDVLLRRHPRFDADFASKMTDDVLAGDKATQDRWIFQHAAYWPDVARGLPKGERGKYDRPVWHYINFPLFLDSTDRGALGKLTVNLSTDYTLIRAELHVAAGESHGFFNRSPWTEVTVKEADEFLTSMGYLEGPPTVKLPAGAPRLEKK